MAEETPIQRLRRQVKHKDGDTRGIARAFMENWDKDGSGELSRTEFMHGLKSYGVLVGDMTEAEKKALWGEFDKGGEGTVDLNEFLMVLGDVYASRAKMINEGFNKLDSDRSGEISVFEMKGRSDVIKYFEGAGNADGLISRQEFGLYCSAISSVCETDDQFREKLEELTDIPPIILPAWKYMSTTNPEEIVEWVNGLHGNPQDIFGGNCKGVFHTWCRPNKRSFIKGSFTFEYVYDADFSAEMSFADFKENKKDPTAAGMGAMSNKRLLTEPGAAALLDVDASGNAHFLKVKTKPKRGAKSWAGKLRYIASSSTAEVERWLNELSPMPSNITSCIQYPEMHIFVNDIGPSGYVYQFRSEKSIPHDLIAADQCLVLGFNDEGDCFFLEIPPQETALTTKKPIVVAENPVKRLIRNEEAFRGSLEGIYDTEEKLRELFDRIDVDNSGYITQAEFKALYTALETFGVGEGHRGFVRNIMERNSMLEDDVLSFDEFCMLMLKVAQW